MRKGRGTNANDKSRGQRPGRIKSIWNKCKAKMKEYIRRKITRNLSHRRTERNARKAARDSQETREAKAQREKYETGETGTKQHESECSNREERKIRSHELAGQPRSTRTGPLSYMARLREKMRCYRAGDSPPSLIYDLALTYEEYCYCIDEMLAKQTNECIIPDTLVYGRQERGPEQRLNVSGEPIVEGLLIASRYSSPARYASNTVPHQFAGISGREKPNSRTEHPARHAAQHI